MEPRIGNWGTDVNGVALAAIQGLAQRLAEQQEALEELQLRNRELRGQVAFLVGVGTINPVVTWP